MRFYRDVGPERGEPPSGPGESLALVETGVVEAVTSRSTGRAQEKNSLLQLLRRSPARTGGGSHEISQPIVLGIGKAEGSRENCEKEGQVFSLLLAAIGRPLLVTVCYKGHK